MKDIASSAGPNSSPVLRIRFDDVLVYANPASWIVLKSWGTDVNAAIPPDWRLVAAEARRTGSTQDRTLVVGLVSLHLLFVPLSTDGSIVVFGADTTAVRQSDRDRLIMSHVYNQVREAIVVMDEEFRTINANPAYLKLTGQSEADVLGEPPEVLTQAKRQRALYSEIMENLDDCGAWQGEITSRTSTGDRRTISMSISPVRGSTQRITHYVALIADITFRQRAEEQLHRMAHYDGLTGLPNRYLFSDHLQAALSHSRRTGEKFGVMLVDLDGFKAINDTFGHRAGDRMLQTVARAMTDVVRASDTVARFGGDEFSIILRDLQHPDAATIVSRKLLAAISQTTEIDDYEIYVTGSIGIALFPADGTDIETLIRKADSAMYRVKGTTKNNFSYTVAGLRSETARNLQVQTYLRRAVLADEIDVAFQPQINGATRSLVGAEALARWHDTVLGDVSPLQFVTIAEKFGLIDELGEAVLRKACTQGGVWLREHNRPIRIGVNVSALQLRNSEFVATVRRILEETQFPATLLMLELTETVFVEDSESLISTFNELTQLGVEFCVDDFGSKYATLMHVKRFPISSIKIDREFVRDIPGDSNSRALITAIVEMGRNLACSVLAEGVESTDQWDFLLGSGCQEIQGFLCGRPMKAVDMERMLEYGFEPDDSAPVARITREK